MVSTKRKMKASGFCLWFIVALLGIVPFPVTGSTNILASSIRDDLPTIDCTLDDDSTNPTLQNCLTLGESFAERYDKFLKKGKRFNRCAEFEEFQSCIRPLLNSCPLIRKTLDHKWKNIYDVMTCACDSDSPECSNSLNCMEEEHNSIYMNLCQELYDFNIEQDTHEKCRFLREKSDCEESLVASACGEPVAQFMTSLVKAQPKKFKCYATSRHYNYQRQGFRYTEHCPRNITEKIQQCSLLHPVESVLHFHKDNDLIAEDSRKRLKRSCTSFVQYQECFNEIIEECAEGVQRILDYNGNLRSYMIKMEFICNEARRPYLESMYCYQGVLANDSFSKCNNVWQNVTDNLYNLTAYEYYCKPEDPTSRDMQHSLKKLEVCYESVVNQHCGLEAGKTMAQLISIAFQDPYYLRYSFKPDCNLHNPHPPDTTPSVTTTTRTTTASRNRITSSHKPVRTVNEPNPMTSTDNSCAVLTHSTGLLVFMALITLFRTPQFAFS